MCGSSRHVVVACRYTALELSPSRCSPSFVCSGVPRSRIQVLTPRAIFAPARGSSAGNPVAMGSKGGKRKSENGSAANGGGPANGNAVAKGSNVSAVPVPKKRGVTPKSRTVLPSPKPGEGGT